MFILLVSINYLMTLLTHNFFLTLIQEPEEKEVEEEKKDDGVMRIMFDPPHYTVMESVGSFEVIQSL